MSDTLLSRFLRYVQIDTQSDETSKTFPSTSGQLVLLEMLKHELTELGASDVQMTRHGYVLASIPANTRKARVPTVAFLAHVDTAPDCSGKNVKPMRKEIRIKESRCFFIGTDSACFALHGNHKNNKRW